MFGCIIETYQHYKESKKRESEIKQVQRISKEPDRDWTRSREKCPKCSSKYLYSRDEGEDNISSHVSNTYDGEPVPAAVVHGMLVDSSTTKFWRTLQLLVCPVCTFKGYRIVRVGEGYSIEDVKYADDWELLPPLKKRDEKQDPPPVVHLVHGTRLFWSKVPP